MDITLRCFARVRELLGAESVVVDVPEGTTVEGLLLHLAKETPELGRMPLAFAVNQDYAEPGRELRTGDEVAFIPPISGGSGAGRPEICRFDFCTDALDPRALEAEVRTDSDGAIVTFTGVTRDHNQGDAVLALGYECYEGMARGVMGRIFEAALKRFPIGRARVVHRLGDVPVGEASVLVVVAAPHRDAAFTACQFLMDRLKAEVPIFKRELLAGPDGDTRWVGELPAGPS